MSQYHQYQQPPLKGQPLEMNEPAQGQPVQPGFPSQPHQKVGPIVPVEGTPLYPEESNPDPKLQQMFVVPSKYQDKWAAILFIIVVIGIIGAAGYNVVAGNIEFGLPDSQTYDSSTASQSVKNAHNAASMWCSGDLQECAPDSDADNGYRCYCKIEGWKIAAHAVAGVVGAAIVTALAYVFMKMAPVAYVWVANILSCMIALAMAAWMLYNKQWLFGVISLAFAILGCVWLYCVRRRIPFAAELLRASSQVVFRHHGTIVTSVSMLVVGTVFVTAHFLMSSPAIASVNQNLSAAGSWAVMVLFLLMFMWGTQVITNVSHVTTSGTVATWYFVGAGRMPSNPTLPSLKRATTTSFGSICFGSLLVAILKTIYYVVRAALQGCNQFVQCIILCIIGILERLMELFNIYALTHVAIYGCSYIEAAKKTWGLIKKCAWAAIFNDSLVWPVLTLTSLFGSIATGVIAGLVSGSFQLGLFTYFVAYSVLVLLMRPIYSGVVTIFVCFAHEPDAIHQSNPEFGQAITAAKALADSGPC